jgi:hypothetical protein
LKSEWLFSPPDFFFFFLIAQWRSLGVRAYLRGKLGVAHGASLRVSLEPGNDATTMEQVIARQHLHLVALGIATEADTAGILLRDALVIRSENAFIELGNSSCLHGLLLDSCIKLQQELIVLGSEVTVRKVKKLLQGETRSVLITGAGSATQLLFITTLLLANSIGISWSSARAG